MNYDIATKFDQLEKQIIRLTKSLRLWRTTGLIGIGYMLLDLIKLIFHL
jgi:hypothetical protein